MTAVPRVVIQFINMRILTLFLCCVIMDRFDQQPTAVSLALEGAEFASPMGFG
jgi:hypothetical protein